MVVRGGDAGSVDSVFDDDEAEELVGGLPLGEDEDVGIAGGEEAAGAEGLAELVDEFLEGELEGLAGCERGDLPRPPLVEPEDTVRERGGGGVGHLDERAFAEDLDVEGLGLGLGEGVLAGVLEVDVGLLGASGEKERDEEGWGEDGGERGGACEHGEASLSEMRNQEGFYRRWMSCESASKNATAPAPGIAPARGGVPAGQDIDPRRIAEGLIARHGGGGADPRCGEVVPGFDAPFFQAGLAGYSDAAMRVIARRHGCPLCVTEALLDITLLGGGRGFVKADLGDLADNVPGGEEDHPLVGQIMGSEPETMAAGAIKMVEQGRRAPRAYRDIAGGSLAEAAETTFAAIDVNLACPVKKIRSKARGGHWLAEPAGAIAILEAVREAVPASIPVTVKMRRSFDDSVAMIESFYRIFDAAYDIGCAWVTVHGRTVEQKYVGPSRWDLLREIALRRHPGRHAERVVFGSGDVWTAAEVFRLIGYTGMAGASVARGCIGNPWIFRQCREILAGREASLPTLDEQRSVLLEHFELAMAVNARMVRGRDDDARAERAEAFTARTMRKFGIQFAKHHPGGDEVKRAFTTVTDLASWRAVLDDHYPRASDEAASPAVAPAGARGLVP